MFSVIISTISIAAPMFIAYTASFMWHHIRNPHERRTPFTRIHAPASVSDSQPAALDFFVRANARLLALRTANVCYILILAALAWVAWWSGPYWIKLLIVLCFAWAIGHVWRVSAAVYYGLTGSIDSTFMPEGGGYHFPEPRQIVNTSYAKLISIADATAIIGAVAFATSGLNIGLGLDFVILGPPRTPDKTNLEPWQLTLSQVIVGIALLTVGRATKNWLRRRELTSAARPTFTHPTNECALYLRPFRDEAIKIPAHKTNRILDIINVLPVSKVFLEDAVTWPCWITGPVLAIANPRRSASPMIGAGRFAVGDDDWFGVVKKIMKQARLTVLVVGADPGIRMEIDAALSDPEVADKTIFINSNPYNHVRFLETLGASDQMEPTQKALLGAVHTTTGWLLLTSRFGEDVDYEEVIAWFIEMLHGFRPRPSVGSLDDLS